MTMMMIMVDAGYVDGILMPRTKLWTSKRWMHKKYIVEKLSETEIAELAGTNQSTINRWLRKHELKK